jgi:hydrogenase maturation protein HypF
MNPSPLHLRERHVRHRLRVAGVVQGVGFRPFVHRLATELGLGGHVGNDASGVFVEVEGGAIDVACFEDRLVRDAPPLARIDEVCAASVEVRGERAFRIAGSRGTGPVRTFVSPDIAVCDDCIAELWNPADRRHRYPFVNCTNCGPRFTITVRLPYDRPNTTMREFSMCEECAAEYQDPTDRRFHAQPIACPACGPAIRYESGGRASAGSDPSLAAAQSALCRGDIVAIKGLGGYHLACDATSVPAVAELRRRKLRPAKPLAVMVADLATAARLAFVAPGEAALLVSPQRPIVLLRRRPGGPISDLVAPGNPFVGVLLPYTPLHHLLFARVPGGGAPVPGPLVMTSGNLSEEPICFDDEDARARLEAIADGWLIHNRPIHVPCDDSVVRFDDQQEVPIRRSRGYAPLPIRLPFPVGPILAAGGELKNTFCLGDGKDAWMSQHIGDMGSLETLAAFERSVGQFGDIYGVAAETVAADRHPGYHTRDWAERSVACSRVASVELVQHHHAHVAAVMAEHGVEAGERVLGFAFDGTGYGSDGAIWGGEVLVAGYDRYERAAHLRYFPLPGGDAAIHKPYRAALAQLWAAGVEWTADLAPVSTAPPAELAVLRRQLDRGIQTVPTSSMGRLFDSVSSLLGVRHVVSYEAQAAIELEAEAEPNLEEARRYQLPVHGEEIDPRPMLRAMVRDLRAGWPAGPMAAGFHLAVAQLVAEMADSLRGRTGLDRVALTGGVFQNVLLSKLARAALAALGFTVLTHRVVPPNDGGLALGQLVVAGRAPSMAGTA